MGSACLFFNISPPHALLSDINGELVNTFNAVRHQVENVYKEMIRLPLGEEGYYKVRSRNPTTLTTAQRAARFIYLNRFCFNGLYRTNRYGHFNVPYAGSKTGALPSQSELFQAAKILRGATVRRSDFALILQREVCRGDFVYLDPPFAVANRRIFRQYGPQTFGLEDIERVQRILDIIDSRGAHFLLSYAYSKEAKYFNVWNMRRVYVQRNISGFAKYRRISAEILVTNI